MNIAALHMNNGRRRRRPISPVNVGNIANVRPAIAVAPQRAPERPRQSDARARPAKMQVFQSLNRAQIRSVMRDTWVFGKGEHRPVTAQPYGKSLAWRERVNIYRPSSEAYGSRMSMQPVSSADDARLALIMGMPDA